RRIEMSKRSIEISILSARGLKRANPLWKLKTLCVAWINPEHKYCSKIDKQNDTHPAWNMKFSSVVDADFFDDSDAALAVEVHSREPLFHFFKVECSATVLLREFFAKADKTAGDWSETTSFQLRTPAGKPRGMVDVCVRIGRGFDPQDGHSEETAVTDGAHFDGDDDGEEPVTAYPADLSSRLPSGRPEDFPPPNYPYSYPPKTAASGRPPNPPYRPPPPVAPPFPYGGGVDPYGPQPHGPPSYNYPPPLGGNNYFGLPGPSRPTYGGGAPQQPGLGLAAGAMAGGLAGGMLFGLDGLQDGINDALSSQFHGGSVNVYGNSLF
ncbi:hypothetical protein KI387_025467, partial [Taxus chinensis]